jgi:hypothetical protein
MGESHCWMIVKPGCGEKKKIQHRGRRGRSTEDTKKTKAAMVWLRALDVEVLSDRSRNRRSATSGVGSPVDSTGVQKPDLIG